MLELGIDLDEEKETTNTVELFKELKIRKEQVPLKPLLKGKFPSKEEKDQQSIAEAAEVKHLSREEAPGRRGGKVGGEAAATRAPSAAAVAKLLSGIDFPKRKDELKQYAKRHASQAGISDTEAVVNVLDKLPDKQYTDMADVEKSVGQVI